MLRACVRYLCCLVRRQPARWVLDLLDNNSDHHFHRHRPEVDLTPTVTCFDAHCLSTQAH